MNGVAVNLAENVVDEHSINWYSGTHQNKHGRQFTLELLLVRPHIMLSDLLTQKSGKKNP
jgi:hypothetical protein